MSTIKNELKESRKREAAPWPKATLGRPESERNIADGDEVFRMFQPVLCIDSLIFQCMETRRGKEAKEEHYTILYKRAQRERRREGKSE